MLLKGKGGSDFAFRLAILGDIYVPINLPSTFARRPLVALVVALTVAAPGIAIAASTRENTGDSTLVPYYRSLTFGGISPAGDFSFPGNDAIGIDYDSNVGPRPVTNAAGILTDGGATWTGIGQSAFAGFYAGRNYAQMSVSNANANAAYYVVAGTGTSTSVRFFTPAAAAARATFTWHVSGTETARPHPGWSTGRLDFGATTESGHGWGELFSARTGVDQDQSGPLNSFTHFGPGTYNYNLPIADISKTINLYYWSSAFTQLNKGDLPQGGSATLTANYSNTYELESVQLFDEFDNAITDWTLHDDNLNEDVFDQNGRIDPLIDPPPLPIPTAVPAPGAVSLLLAGIALLGLGGRRKSG